MQTVRIGKAKIDVTVRGCAWCGTEHSHNWSDYKNIQVAVDGRVFLPVTIHLCGDCAEKQKAEA